MNSPSRVLHPIEERRLPLPPSRRVPFANDELRWEDLVLLPGGRFVLGYTDALLGWEESTYTMLHDDEQPALLLAMRPLMVLFVI